ncbi:MAG: KpsF/GutQ family sugar-phosphate isomerase [Pelagibacteraceae bacterium TMED232]|nr:MAG: KpsF/GutQ family sugar-phosphate isomerase [Pelagibacteraceae bacterium TMED232]
MNKNSLKNIAIEVINLEIEALKILKKSVNKNFDKAVNAIVNCQSKIILCGVGKSGLIATKIASTLSSVGSPAFSLSANDCLHGDLGSITKKDVLVLISNSGRSEEIIPIVKFANKNKIKLIGIVSKKNSFLYKGSNIKILLPDVKESGLGVVPTSSTSIQLAIGDALAVAALKKKQFSRYDFSRLHPGGSLGKQLKTVGDIMSTGIKIPFISENKNMKEAIKIISNKKLGVVIARNRNKKTTGIITDGNIRKLRQRNIDFQKTLVKDVMTKNPITISSESLATKALRIMNEKKITSLCVIKGNISNKTTGLIHIHHILETNIE